MGDWTSQNWTKRDGRNNQQEQEQQEKKATYKTAAELAVKNMRVIRVIMLIEFIVQLLNYCFGGGPFLCFWQLMFVWHLLLPNSDVLKHLVCSSQLNATSVVVLINAGIIKDVMKRWKCEESVAQ